MFRFADDDFLTLNVFNKTNKINKFWNNLHRCNSIHSKNDILYYTRRDLLYSTYEDIVIFLKDSNTNRAKLLEHKGFIRELMKTMSSKEHIYDTIQLSTAFLTVIIYLCRVNFEDYKMTGTTSKKGLELLTRAYSFIDNPNGYFPTYIEALITKLHRIISVEIVELKVLLQKHVNSEEHDKEKLNALEVLAKHLFIAIDSLIGDDNDESDETRKNDTRLKMIDQNIHIEIINLLKLYWKKVGTTKTLHTYYIVFFGLKALSSFIPTDFAYHSLDSPSTSNNKTTLSQILKNISSKQDGVLIFNDSKKEVLPTVKEEILETVIELFHTYGLISNDRNVAFTVLGLKTIATISSNLSMDSTSGNRLPDVTIVTKVIGKKVDWGSVTTGFIEIIQNVIDVYNTDLEILRYCTEIMAYITEVYPDIFASRMSSIEKSKYKGDLLDASERVIRILQDLLSSFLLSSEGLDEHKHHTACFGYRTLCNLISNSITVDVDMNKIFNLLIDCSSTSATINEMVALFGTRVLINVDISKITDLDQAVALINTLSTLLSTYNDNEILLLQCLEGLQLLLERYINFEQSTNTGILPFGSSEKSKFITVMTKDAYSVISVVSGLLFENRRKLDTVKRLLQVLEIITTGYISDQIQSKVYSTIRHISAIIEVYCDTTTTTSIDTDSNDIRCICWSILLPLSDRIKKGAFKDAIVELIANMFRIDNNPYDQTTMTMKLEVEKALRLLYEITYDDDDDSSNNNDSNVINPSTAILANEAIVLPFTVISKNVNVREQKKFEQYKYACNAVRLSNIIITTIHTNTNTYYIIIECSLRIVMIVI